ncbi:hypothetical protein SAMN05444920_1498 [Nonomuraea solani]|uniref:Uncharacterized protein n=1 Tax=Nonomuraea solani TaxID=1144553 RepID=A0A1H6F199_9ACTN|nr:hypothetical protein [Nonomuraea solani]SEH03938.1 hypothetical protein SAMN05444920_1498 [Nonomuraea solani]
MHIDATIEHYRNLLDRTWMRERFAWTVIISNDREIHFREIATELSGGAPPEMWDETPRMACDHLRNINLIIPVKSGHRINIIEPGAIHTNDREFLQWVSTGCRAWSVSWHINGGERLICAEDGEILFGIGEYLDTDNPFGTRVATTQPELDVMRQSSLTERKAAALAIMEMHGGFRLSLEWLDSPQTIVAVDQPIPPGATPPSAFASIEPELAAHLRGASPIVRRSFLVRLTERLAGSFDLHIPEVTAILDQIRSGNHPTPREWYDLAIATMYLAHDEWFDDPSDADPEWLRWQAAIAIRHALRSLDTDAQNIESLLSARNALHSIWATLREEIMSLPSDY